MADVEEIAKAIGDVGIMVVICAIFIYFAISLINIFLNYLRGKLSNKQHDKLIDTRSKISYQVHTVIDEFLESHDGDRIHVVEFSNSVMSVAYLPFKYMSCTYEVYRIGKTSTASRVDRLSTSLFAAFFERLYEAKYLMLDANTPDKKFGGSIYDIIRGSGESKALYSAIRTAKGKVIGYVAMRKDEDFAEVDYNDIQHLAQTLAALLGVADK